jgi:hypothetical protein
MDKPLADIEEVVIQGNYAIYMNTTIKKIVALDQFLAKSARGAADPTEFFTMLPYGTIAMRKSGSHSYYLVVRYMEKQLKWFENTEKPVECLMPTRLYLFKHSAQTNEFDVSCGAVDLFRTFSSKSPGLCFSGIMLPNNYPSGDICIGGFMSDIAEGTPSETVVRTYLRAEKHGGLQHSDHLARSMNDYIYHIGHKLPKIKESAEFFDYTEDEMNRIVAEVGVFLESLKSCTVRALSAEEIIIRAQTLDVPDVIKSQLFVILRESSGDMFSPSFFSRRQWSAAISDLHEYLMEDPYVLSYYEKVINQRNKL